MTAFPLKETSDQLDLFNEDLLRRSPFDLAEYIQSKSEEEQQVIFNQLSDNLAVQTFEYLSFPIQKTVLSTLSPDKVGYLLNHLSPDDRTAF